MKAVEDVAQKGRICVLDIEMEVCALSMHSSSLLIFTMEPDFNLSFLSGCQTSQKDRSRSTLLVSIAALTENTRGEIKG